MARNYLVFIVEPSYLSLPLPLSIFFFGSGFKFQARWQV